MTTTQTDELEAIRDIVATVEHAQRNELVDEFVSLFHPDAIWTTGHGTLLVGRAAIAEFTAKVLPGAMRDGTATYEVVLVRFLRPDVAAVKVRQRYLDLSGGGRFRRHCDELATERGDGGRSCPGSVFGSRAPGEGSCLLADHSHSRTEFGCAGAVSATADRAAVGDRAFGVSDPAAGRALRRDRRDGLRSGDCRGIPLGH
ncbi:hypothetical protein GCM10027089_11650 [Nocardia thraciensis]